MHSRHAGFALFEKIHPLSPRTHPLLSALPPSHPPPNHSPSSSALPFTPFTTQTRTLCLLLCILTPRRHPEPRLPPSNPRTAPPHLCFAAPTPPAGTTLPAPVKYPAPIMPFISTRHSVSICNYSTGHCVHIRKVGNGHRVATPSSEPDTTRISPHLSTEYRVGRWGGNLGGRGGQEARGVLA